MILDLHPQDIYLNFKNNLYSQGDALEKLRWIIENVKSPKPRLKSLEIYGEICEFNQESFNFFENILLSDSSEEMRTLAATFIGKFNFPDAIKPISWSFYNEDSPECLRNIYNILIKILKDNISNNENQNRSLILNEIEKVKSKEYRAELDILKQNSDLNKIPLKFLKDILINYFTLDYFERTYWRISYELDRFSVRKINFKFKSLNSFPEPLENLLSLESLVLRYNQIKEIPLWIKN
jgi:hypothetical protein